MPMRLHVNKLRNSRRAHLIKLTFHDADTATNTYILASIVARMSVSAPWYASLKQLFDDSFLKSKTR